MSLSIGFLGEIQEIDSTTIKQNSLIVSLKRKLRNTNSERISVTEDSKRKENYLYKMVLINMKTTERGRAYHSNRSEAVEKLNYLKVTENFFKNYGK